tara:strand:- start:132 stop:332 length:201 start_codon:yes stop_codon:yes gene_type:complete
MFFDVVAKYTDERKERIIATIGMESDYLHAIQKEFLDNPKLDYVKITLDTYWRSKRDEEYKRTKSV